MGGGRGDLLGSGDMLLVDYPPGVRGDGSQPLFVPYLGAPRASPSLAGSDSCSRQ